MYTTPLAANERVFECEQLVPRPRREVFAFFGDPGNLEAITPPWLNFKIVHQSTAEIRTGTEFVYRLRVHGLPLKWHSLITAWEPGKRFIDVQLRGPYAMWHHEHTFEEVDGGTLIRDRVIYRLPLGQLGWRVGGRFVESDIRRIFEHRARRTSELLGAWGTPREERRCTAA